MARNATQSVKIIARKGNTPIERVPVGCAYVSHTTGRTRIRLSRCYWGTLLDTGLVDEGTGGHPVSVVAAMRNARLGERP